MTLPVITYRHYLIKRSDVKKKSTLHESIKSVTDAAEYERIERPRRNVPMCPTILTQSSFCLIVKKKTKKLSYNRKVGSSDCGKCYSLRGLRLVPPTVEDKN